MTNFKEVDVAEYAGDLVDSGIEVKEYKKFVRVQAVQGKAGQVVETRLKNGLVETTNIVQEDPEHGGECGWIVTNPDGEKYVVKDSVFKKRYNATPDKDGLYSPKGVPIRAVEIADDISFTAPWGEKMNIERGGYLVLNSPTDIYGIAKDEFHNTYKPSAEVDKMREQIENATKQKYDVQKNK